MQCMTSSCCSFSDSRGLTVHCTAEVGRADGVRIDEVAGQDDAVCKVDDEPVAVMGLLVEGVERECDVFVLCKRVLSSDDGVVQGADKFVGPEVVVEHGVGFIPGIAYLKTQVEGVRSVGVGVKTETERCVAGVRGESVLSGIMLPV